MQDGLSITYDRNDSPAAPDAWPYTAARRGARSIEPTAMETLGEGLQPHAPGCMGVVPFGRSDEQYIVIDRRPDGVGSPIPQ